MGSSAHSYETLSAALALAGVSSESAEYHGGVCASLCVNGLAGARAWSDLWMANGSAAELFDEDLRAFEQSVWAGLNAPDFQFLLILPDEDSSLPTRLIGIAAWCHGFVAAIGLAKLDFSRLDESIRAQIDEVIADFTEISRADTDEPESNEAGFQFESLVEFVRAAVQLVFESLTEVRQSQVAYGTH